MRQPVEVSHRDDYKRRMRDALVLDAERTVALTIDMQRNYLDPDVGASPLPPDVAEAVLSNTQRFLEHCRELGVPIIHCYVQRRQIEADRGAFSTAFNRASRAQSLSQNPNAPVYRGVDRVASTAQAEVPKRLVAPGDLHVTAKRAMDSFYRTDLDMLLDRVLRPDTLLLAGINTDTCVHATAFAAAHRDYRPVIVADCVASMRGPDHDWMALELMSRTMAWVLDLPEVIRKLKAVR